MIKRESFMELMRMFPDDFEKFHFIKDSLIGGD
jgi:hypothetical protein